MIGWLITLSYVMVGFFIGRRVARRFYLAEQARFPTIASTTRNEDIVMATVVFVAGVIVWPLFFLYLLARQEVVRAIPEYTAAEMEARMKKQQEEINRLHRQMGIRDIRRSS